MLTITLIITGRVTLWGRVLTPESPEVSREVVTLLNPLQGVNPIQGRSQDYFDLAALLDRRYVRGDANGIAITSSDDLAQLLNVGAVPDGGGGGGGNGDSLVDPTVYSCPPTVALYDAVYLSGANAVDLADGDNPITFPCMGIVVEKPTATTAKVAYAGKVAGFAGLVPGDTYFIDTTPGQITNTAPSNPGDVVQKIGWARNATTLVLQLDRDYTVL